MMMDITSFVIQSVPMTGHTIGMMTDVTPVMSLVTGIMADTIRMMWNESAVMREVRAMMVVISTGTSFIIGRMSLMKKVPSRVKREI